MLNIQFDLLFVSLLAGAGAALFRLLASRLRRRFASRALCAVWLALALWLVVPVHVSLAQAPVQVTVPAAVGESLNQQEATLPKEDAALPQPQTDLPAPAAPAMQEPAAPALTLRQQLALVWLAGAALLALHQAAAYLWWRRSIARWDSPADPALRACNEQAAADVGCRPLPIYRNASLGTPMLAGLLRPAVRVPAAFGEALPAPAGPQAMQTAPAYWALRHEYTHRKRRDLAKKLLLQAAVCLHWFNPLVWLLRASAQQELEFACDEAVLRRATAAQRGVYGKALLQTARQQAGGQPRTVLVSCFGGGKIRMQQRLGNLFLQNKRRGAAMAFACLMAVGLCAGLVACQEPSAQQRLEQEDAALAETFLEWVFRCEPMERNSKNRVWLCGISSADPEETIQQVYYDEIAGLTSEEGLRALVRTNMPRSYESILFLAGYSTTFERVELTPPDWTAAKPDWDQSDCYEFTVHLTVTVQDLEQPESTTTHPATVSGQLRIVGEEGERRVQGLYLSSHDGWLPPQELQEQTEDRLEEMEEEAAGMQDSPADPAA